VEELENDKGVYIDLIANPEGFTGYQGQKIWEAIHRENCFTGSYNSLCREEKALNKIISGLHTSISIIYIKNIRQFPDRIRNLFFLYAFLLRSYTLAQNAIN
jgi:ERO1-like protein alpha